MQANQKAEKNLQEPKVAYTEKRLRDKKADNLENIQEEELRGLSC